MSALMPSWRGWRAVLSVVVAGLVLPLMSPVQTGRAQNLHPIGAWVAAVIFLITCSFCIVLAWRGGRRGDRVAALLVLILVVFGLAGFLGLFPNLSRRPVFHGNSPVSIDVVAEQGDGADFYTTNLTDGVACSNLLQVLASGRPTDYHLCPHRGWFSVRFPDGASDTIYFLPGHDQAKYEIRCESGCFAVPRQHLWEALQAVGIDVGNMPREIRSGESK